VRVCHSPHFHEGFCCNWAYTAANAKQLKALPGIGEAYSEKIIKGHPYQQNEELIQKKIVPRATSEQLKYTIVVRSSTSPNSHRT